MSILKSTCSGIHYKLTIEVLKIKGYQEKGKDIFDVQFVNPDYEGFSVLLWPGAEPRFFTFSDPDTDIGKTIETVEELERYEKMFKKK